MRGGTAARGAIIALTLLLFAPIARASEQETFYLGTDGFPHASLVANPLGGELPNFDRGRDVEPGLFLERSAAGLAETEDTKYQHWQVEASGRHLAGYPAVVLWSAPARFDAAKSAAFSVYLLDCNRAGADCTTLGTAEGRVPRGAGDTWVESWLTFESLDHRFADGRYLGVRVVVPGSSESDLMLAYGFPQQRSRLTIFSQPPVVPEPAVAEAPVTSSTGVLKEKLHRNPSMFGLPTQEVEEVEPPWAWATTLVVSTVLLVGLGALLLTQLTKPGKHEARSVIVLPDAPSEDRTPVSVR